MALKSTPSHTEPQRHEGFDLKNDKISVLEFDSAFLGAFVALCEKRF